MNPNLEKTLNRTFLQLLEDLKNKKEIEIFLSDLAGKKQYDDLVKKIAVAYWIKKNRPTDVIKNNLDVTDHYIDSIKKIIDKPGIKLAIKYLEAEEFANQWTGRIKKVLK